MRKLWIRVGMTIEVPEAEAENLLTLSDTDGGCSVVFAELVQKAFSEGRATLDGETYLSGDEVYRYNEEYGTFHEEYDIEATF